MEGPAKSSAHGLQYAATCLKTNQKVCVEGWVKGPAEPKGEGELCSAGVWTVGFGFRERCRGATRDTSGLRFDGVGREAEDAFGAPVISEASGSLIRHAGCPLALENLGARLDASQRQVNVFAVKPPNNKSTCLPGNLSMAGQRV